MLKEMEVAFKMVEEQDEDPGILKLGDTDRNEKDGESDGENADNIKVMDQASHRGKPTMSDKPHSIKA